MALQVQNTTGADGATVRTSDLRVDMSTSDKTGITYANVNVRGFQFATRKGGIGISAKVSVEDLRELVAWLEENKQPVASLAVFPSNAPTPAPQPQYVQYMPQAPAVYQPPMQGQPQMQQQPQPVMQPAGVVPTFTS